MMSPGPNGFIETCACGKQSEIFRSTRTGPPGWLYAVLFWNGWWRSVAACSADCVESAKRAAVDYYQRDVDSFEARVKELVLKRVPA